MRALRPPDLEGAARRGPHRRLLPELPAGVTAGLRAEARAPVTLSIPGDKSISHRCLILASQASGESRFANLNRGADVAGVGRALARCGVPIEGRDEVRVRGATLNDPAGALDLGNSGTGVRLLAGLLAGAGVRAVLTGDASLASRPMDRVVRPLRAMGAAIRAADGDRRLPIQIEPARLSPLEYELPVASAQVKSCLLLAGLAGSVAVTVRERRPTRDHTERMLGAMGARVGVGRGVVTLEPSLPLRPLAMRVPGDFSSAAFLIGLALLVPGLALELGQVGVNPGRTALLEVLARMGADVRVRLLPVQGGEPVADLGAAYVGRLRGVDVPPELAPRLIDEIPLLAVLAAAAQGTTRIRGVAELRFKESDRLLAIVEGLVAVGAVARVVEDGLEIEGSPGPFAGIVDTRLDHRIAMAFAVLGRAPGSRIELSETDSIGSSFPEFPELVERALA
jgi:3-phosphoshikimate 1-carboxyvinyltransferase